MERSEDSNAEAIPLTEARIAIWQLLHEACEYLTKARNIYKDATCSSTNPPIQPKGGSIFLYDLRVDSSK